MRWGPLKSAEKPHPWAVDHEPLGPGAMGPVGGGVRGAVGVGGGWGARSHGCMTSGVGGGWG